MSYKLICIDMDGTLLDDNKKISKESTDVIKRAYKSGVNIAVTTGRLFTSANYFADLIGVKTPVIASNGAYIRDKNSNEVIYKSTLGVTNCKEVLNVLRKYNIEPHFNDFEGIYTESLGDYTKFYDRANANMPKDRQIKINLVDDWNKTFEKYNDEILKCIALDKNTEKLLMAKDEIRKLKNIEVVSSSMYNFEVMNKGVSKGKAVEMLAKIYGLTRDEVICIGDNENDLSMIEYAGLGVAMGNGAQLLKEKADYITDNNNDNGVAKAIEKFIFN